MTERPNFPEVLADQEIGNLLAAIGNHEGKALLMACFEGDDPTGGKKLHRRILDLQGNNITWKMTPQSVDSWCRDTLLPLGVVDIETGSGYFLSQKGEKYGRPLAGLLLQLVEKHGVALSHLFGSTKSNVGEIDSEKKRSPLTRWKIIRSILSSKLPLRAVELGKILGEDPDRLTSHLRELSDYNLIEYDSTPAGENYAFYKAGGLDKKEEPEWYLQYRTITNAVLDLVRIEPDKWWSIEEVAVTLTDQVKTKIEDLEPVVRHILKSLYEQGYAETRKFTSLERSEININDDQRQILKDFNDAISAIQNYDSQAVVDGNEYVRRIQIDPETVSRIVSIGKESSSGTNSLPLGQTRKQIAEIISMHPNISTEEICIILEEMQHRKLSYKTVKDRLRELRHEGVINYSGKAKSRWIYVE